jgi:hypothetical protein
MDERQGTSVPCKGDVFPNIASTVLVLAPARGLPEGKATVRMCGDPLYR